MGSMPATLVGGQLDRVDRPRQQAVGGLADAEHLPAVAEHGALDHGADHRVQPGAVAAAGQQAEAHPPLLAAADATALHDGGLDRGLVNAGLPV